MGQVIFIVGSATIWWLASANNGNANNFCNVNNNGNANNNNANNSRGVPPDFAKPRKRKWKQAVFKP